MSVVELKSVVKRFGSVEVVPAIDLTIPSGSFTVLVGPSGCGKSTLLRMIAGLEDVTSGAIQIDGQDVTTLEPAERGIAMVFQSYALYPHMNVEKNIGFALRLAGLPKTEIARRVQDTAEMLQLDQLLTRKPRELSGGQRQRVAIGRAIVRNPKVFLFDEPLSNLDASLRGQMRVELADLHRRLGATMIYVTHDQVEAMTMADQIVVLNKGRIEQVGTPIDLYSRPATEFVAQFIGSPRMNIIRGDIARSYQADAIGIRPEHVKIVDGASDWRGIVKHTEHLGADIMAYVGIGENNTLTVRMPGDVPIASGAEVDIEVDRKYVHRFTGGRRQDITTTAA